MRMVWMESLMLKLSLINPISMVVHWMDMMMHCVSMMVRWMSMITVHMMMHLITFFFFFFLFYTPYAFKKKHETLNK
ncbi:hypothetical protein J8TS2_16410 [Lederbergia ruris]|uniref:Uncharacterized protein n=1 Tax=Lederbergia ruris TaxID=217495 RepID=A0ABQ4KHE1_9BACI|nr:hypothetical protein J8TS2_16410 [Lederbergia ruris]